MSRKETELLKWWPAHPLHRQLRAGGPPPGCANSLGRVESDTT